MNATAPELAAAITAAHDQLAAKANSESKNRVRNAILAYLAQHHHRSSAATRRQP